MTQARKSQISLIDTCYYHLISRCVRRAFLCGVDPYSQENFEHRRQWMVDRIRFLTSIFAIKPLLGFIGNEHKHQPCGIAFSLLDYFTLLEETGKIIRADKRGSIDENSFPILQQLGLSGNDWLHLAQHFGKKYHQAVGSLSELSQYAQHLGKRWIATQRQQSSIFH